MNKHPGLLCITTWLLVGCSAFGVIETNDPGQKLAQARQLFSILDRPLPAERLIRESIDIYTANNDNAGLAEAYRYYAFFFKSPSVTHWEHVYAPNGFLDKSAKFDGRYEMSIKYFDLSLAEWNRIGRHDWDANIELNKASAYLQMNQNENACRSYSLSLLADQQYHINGRIDLPNGYGTSNEYISALMRLVPCKS
ncbi:tetratricopeptide repeat protein [Sapientia aquatica]|uniref:Tetratricopeptide repeat protein n=1 Tax=Sapientia aquatica TaxID=1549640 RepID=A0A4R5W483_9BURK|nr:tetratricopeptide repeat protein [Sapientia aquatica]TDK66379.1 tetratricopeptide repeat protein [Sapientia aquatica]